MTIFLQYALLFAGTSVVLPLVMILLTRLFGRKTGHHFAYIALLLCAVRLMLPTGWGASVYSFDDWAFSEIRPPIVIEYTQKDDNTGSEVFIEEQKENNHASLSEEKGKSASSYQNTSLAFSSVILFTWLGSAIVFFSLQMFIMFHTIKEIKKRANEPSPDLLAFYHSVADSLGLRKIPKLLVVQEKTIPHLINVFSPTVVLGATVLTQDQLRFVLQHELCHYKRKDLWGKFFLLILLSIFWWNPIIWWMTARTQEEMECACDETVLRDCDGELRYHYGQTILRVLKETKKSPVLVSTGFGFAKKSTTYYRFRDLLDGEKKRGGVLLVTITLLLLVASSFLVGCSDPKDYEKPLTFYMDSDLDLSQDQLWELSKSLEKPTKEGYTLKGWSVITEKNENGGYAIDFEAVWQANAYEVRFVLRGGSLNSADDTFVFGDPLPIPTHAYYTFNGWFTDPTLTTEIKTVPSSQVTVYASWKEESDFVDFIFSETPVGLVLESYQGQGGNVVIPAFKGEVPIIAIAQNAFAMQTSITSVTIPETVASIGVGAFRYCYEMTTVTLRADISHLDASVFEACYRLDTLYFKGDQKKWNAVSKWPADGVNIQFIT